LSRAGSAGRAEVSHRAFRGGRRASFPKLRRPGTSERSSVNRSFDARANFCAAAGEGHQGPRRRDRGSPERPGIAQAGRSCPGRVHPRTSTSSGPRRRRTDPRRPVFAQGRSAHGALTPASMTSLVRPAHQPEWISRRVCARVACQKRAAFQADVPADGSAPSVGPLHALLHDTRQPHQTPLEKSSRRAQNCPKFLGKPVAEPPSKPRPWTPVPRQG
jgi:hypothetical protein